MISEAVAKIAEADLGSFGDFKEKDGKIMVKNREHAHPFPHESGLLEKQVSDEVSGK